MKILDQPNLFSPNSPFFHIFQMLSILYLIMFENLNHKYFYFRINGNKMGWFSSSSRQRGLVQLFNLIVGTGALALPAAFRQTGWLLSTVTLFCMGFISYITYTFMFEVMAAANALLRHRGE